MAGVLVSAWFAVWEAMWRGRRRYQDGRTVQLMPSIPMLVQRKALSTRRNRRSRIRGIMPLLLPTRRAYPRQILLFLKALVRISRQAHSIQRTRLLIQFRLERNRDRSS